MENLVPTIFHEIWLTNQHICNFSMPAYSRNDLPHTCVTMCKGHRPKMFLWMLEEYMYILSRLCKDDQDGLVVLGHELLLLECSRCCRKRGGGRASCHPSALSLDHLPACSRDTQEHAVHSTKDTTALECLAWVIYSNQLGPGKSLSLSGYESYGHVLQCLLVKAFRGLQAHCPAHTLAILKPEERIKSVVMEPWKLQWTEKFPMTRDV